MANSQNSGGIHIPIPHHSSKVNGGSSIHTLAPDLYGSLLHFDDEGVSYHVIRDHPVSRGSGYYDVMKALVGSGTICDPGTYFLYQTVDNFARGQLMTVSESLVVKPGLPDAPSIPRLTCWPPKVRR